MNATSLYVSTCRLVLQADTGDPSSWSDLYRLVPYLRQSLSCTVCGNLLIEPYTPTETNCQHHVCKACKGGKKKLKPSCSWCRNYGKYVENVQLRILLQCYKKLCEYITSTEIYRHLASVTTNGGTSSLVELIQEGAGFKDEYKSTAGLSKSAYSILPCVYTTTSTSTQTQVGVGTSPQSVDAPTIKTVSNGSSLYSIMYASNNKITIKRKASRDTIFYLDGTEAPPSPSPIAPPPQLTQTVTCVSQSVTPSVVRTLVGSGGVSGTLMTETNIVGSGAGFKKPKQKPMNNVNAKPKAKKKGCRCGNATAMPGKLTCCGQRCPCYVEAKACLECRCRGCRNPHRPGGHKVRPHIPELQSLQIHIPATDTNAEELVDTSRLNVNVEELNPRSGNRMLQTVLVASATGTSIGDSPPSSSSSPRQDLTQGDASLEEEDPEGLLDGEDDDDCDEGVVGTNSTPIPVDILGMHSDLVRAAANFRGARVVSGGVGGTSALQLQTVSSMVPATLLVGDERSPSDSGGCGASGDDSDVEVDI
ncbi:E3 ubiquitin-protein ligase MSL2 [Ischnura elegans]|uniref:E3 ubiquitin-protein ligase MSL2 n=1 Tax=Ischnura elegans TaxID=197161 RepID=UPI001ED873E8|nr:E3 ubiquitin-protein ligase MSL2 [Ischnura elegans]